MGKKSTYADIKNYIENESNTGCKLISDTYENNHTKLNIQCRCGNIFSKTFSNFKNGQTQCNECSNITVWTFEKVKNFIEVESNSGCKLLSTEYINATVNLKLQCQCGNEFETSFSKFKQNKRQCRECGIKIRAGKKRLKIEFVKDFIESFNYKLLSDEYKGNQIKLNIECPLGHIFEMSFSDFQQGARCPRCYGKQKTIQDIINIFEDNNEGYKLLTELTHVVKNNEKLLVKCKNNHIFKISYSDFQQGGRCGECNKHYRHKDTEYFKKEVYDLVGDEYEVLGEYTGTKNKIIIKHITCGEEWNTTPDNFLTGARCPKCQHQSYRKTTEEFKQEVFNLVGDEYEVLGEYKKNNKKIEFIHKKCGTKFKMSPSSFLYNNGRCPKCSKSRGEDKVENYLMYNNIIFERQYRIDGCKHKNKLPFDFAIFEDDNKLKLLYLIEYDGEQHFKPVRFGGTSKEKAQISFNECKIRDEIKDNYCKDNNIPLIRIPYWDFNNIEDKLDKMAE